MKVEFRNTPYFKSGGVFSEFKNRNGIQSPPVPVPNTETKGDEVVLSNKKKTLFAVFAASIAGGIAWLAGMFRGKSKSVLKVVHTESLPVVQNGLEVLKSGFKTVMDNFPEDYAYIKNLAKHIGLKEGEEFRLNSIMGKSQLKKLLDEFSHKDFGIGEDFEGVRNLTYRVNLHNHTTCSDGNLSVAEFLEQACKYADRIAKNTPDDGKPPFTIAITDHDTMDGCIEALKILAENPEKYKNLKVVLGSEISVSNCDEKIVSRPLNFELIGYSQNPFDEKLVKILENIQKTRQENVEKFLQKINEKFPEYNLSIQEAKNFHANLKNMRTNGVLYLSADYAKFKILLCEYVKKFNEILPENVEKLSAENLFKKFGEDFYFRMDAFGEKNMHDYFKNYGLKNYLIEQNILAKEQEKFFEKFIGINIEEKENFVTETLQKSLPQLFDRKNYSISPEMVFDATTEGFYGFAHPAIIDFDYRNISNSRREFCDKNSFNYSENLVYEIFNSLKKSGKNLFAASEINYQSYGKNCDRNWIDFMKNSIADNPNLNLKYTGGVDCHKSSIFVKHKYLDENLLKEFLGENL